MTEVDDGGGPTAESSSEGSSSSGSSYMPQAGVNVTRRRAVVAPRSVEGSVATGSAGRAPVASKVPATGLFDGVRSALGAGSDAPVHQTQGPGIAWASEQPANWLPQHGVNFEAEDAELTRKQEQVAIPQARGRPARLSPIDEEGREAEGGS